MKLKAKIKTMLRKNRLLDSFDISIKNNENSSKKNIKKAYLLRSMRDPNKDSSTNNNLLCMQQHFNE
jgi:hypothetical protein